ncbi:MAG: hypothetical protein ABWZ98_13950 [Nakamurella sp.]
MITEPAGDGPDAEPPAAELAGAADEADEVSALELEMGDFCVPELAELDELGFDTELVVIADDADVVVAAEVADDDAVVSDELQAVRPITLATSRTLTVLIFFGMARYPTANISPS